MLRRRIFTMMFATKLVEKLRNFAEILLLPGGLRLKLRHKNFHWRDYRLCLRLKAIGVDPRCIFDVGANEGQFAIGALATFPQARIISYEPGGHAFARLKNAMAGNSAVKLVNKAMGSEEGKAMLHVTNADQSSSLLELGSEHRCAYPEIKEIRQEAVCITTFEREFFRVSPPEPILLKIDTQGFEMQVLRGTGQVLERIRWIVFEAATQPMYYNEVVFDELAAWLRARGFLFRGPLELHVNPAGKPCQFDVLFERHVEAPGASPT